jgi:hypothetical protein
LVLPVQLGLLVLLVLRVRRAVLDQPALLALLAHPAVLAPLAPLAHPAVLAPPAPLAHRVLPALPAPLAHRVLPVLPVLPALRALRVRAAVARAYWTPMAN